MRRVSPLSSVLLSSMIVASCGTAARAPGESGPSTLTVSQRGETGVVGLLLQDETRVRRDTLYAEPDALWQAAPNVYRSLGLPVEVRDPEERALGSGAVVLNRRLGDTRLSRYLDCGRNITGARADQAQVTLEVVTQIVPLEGESGAFLRSGVTAVAEPRSMSGNASRCTSTGRLERAIVAALALEVKAEWSS